MSIAPCDLAAIGTVKYLSVGGGCGEDLKGVFEILESL